MEEKMKISINVTPSGVLGNFTVRQLLDYINENPQGHKCMLDELSEYELAEELVKRDGLKYAERLVSIVGDSLLKYRTANP